MDSSAVSDLDFIERHRKIWRARPELRAVYEDFFSQLLTAAGELRPIIEFGAGPGFFKEYCPRLISTDVVRTSWVDVVCDACAMPFPSGSIGAIVMLDVLHHLPHPLDFLAELARVLLPGGRAIMIEPWITPASYVLYRYFHHEDCTLGIDIHNPFDFVGKKAFDGNATIPYYVVRHYASQTTPALRLMELKRFLGLPYLATLGFQRSLPLPHAWIDAARILERILGPVGRWNATRAVLIWEKPCNAAQS